MKYCLRLKVALLCSILIFIPSLLFSQQSLAQYFDEAPLWSWNIWAPYPAKNAAMGDCILALKAQSPLAGMHNPAALREVKRLNISCNLSANSIQLFRYSIVNTGEAFTGINTIRGFALSHLGVSFSLKGWNIALNLAEQEDYSRPKLRQALSVSTGGGIDALFGGKMRSFNLSLSYPLLKEHLHIGAGFSYLYGSLEKELMMKMRDYGEIESIDLLRDEQKLKARCFHLGVLLKANKVLEMAFALRSPYNKKSSSTVYREFSNIYINISNSYSSQDSYHQPLILGWGVSLQPSSNLILAADISFFRWKSYRAERFTSDLQRNFQNTLKIGIGMEYTLQQQRLSQLSSIPLRIGYIRDPQPCTAPARNYHYLTFGTGFKWKSLSCDVAAQWGRGKGAYPTLTNKRMLVSFLLTL